MNAVKVQRNYKDRIFRMLFKDKENLLSLYNALNKTDYTDVENLEITTLENAVDECIRADILSDFLRQNRAEAIKMSIYEYDEELHFRTLRNEGYESGYTEGHESGFLEGHEAGLEQGESRLNKLYAVLIESDRLDALRRATQDRAYQKQLMAELLPE